MATLVLSFKGHPLSTHHLDDRPTTIGRDADCRIRIDSLAVAPLHAELVPSDGTYLLLALDPDFPVMLNSEQVDQASLSHGDLIQIGKHTMRYSADDVGLVPAASADAKVNIDGGADTHTQITSNGDAEPEGQTSGSLPAYLQLQTGRHIGEIIVIRHAMTRLKYAGAEGVVIARRGHSYRLLRQTKQASVFVLVDGAPLRDATSEIVLHDGNLIEINEVCLRFFIGKADQPSVPTKSLT